MSVTASRIGSSPITLDWSNLVRASGGSPSSKPLPKSDPSLDAADWELAWGKMKTKFAQNEVGFYDAPVNTDLSQLHQTEALAAELIKSGRFTDCLFLGIGGSALGPISLLSSLQEKTSGKIRFHFAENPDPVDWKATLGRLSPESTLVCLVTKSGTTFETVAQFLAATEWLGHSRLSTHLVAITDPFKGDVRALATKAGIRTLAIAPSIGGRFSIFSPVGLFPSALAGLSNSEFLLGAKQVRDYMEKTPIEKNSLFIIGQEFVRHASRRSVHVCMPYSNRLRQIGAWFVQLWGESLGKDGKGFTPIAAVGATDQHSILQLLRDGPDDKVTMFLTVDHVDDEVKIPKVNFGPGHPDYASLKLLEGHTFHELLQIEYRATSQVLTRQGRPNLTLRVDRLDERALGALYFAFSVLTAFTGGLMEVNPFDQPGVEEGKIYTREALSSQRGSSEG